MALNEKEKAAIRNYMGYPQVATAAIISLGLPDKSTYNFIIENNMQNVLAEGEAHIRHALQQLGCIEEQITQARSNLQLAAVTGAVRFRGGDGTADLWEQYNMWVAQLADLLGAPPNPFSDRLRRIGYGTPGVIEPS